MVITAVEKLRFVVHILAIVLAVAGVITTIWAVATPKWQTVFIREYNAHHDHGLWIDCVDHLTKDTYSCSYKFWEPTADDYPQSLGSDPVSAAVLAPEVQHTFTSWHKASLGLLCSGAALALIGILVSFCSFWHRIPALVWAVMQSISAIFCLAGLIHWFLCSHTKEFRLVHAATTVNEQSLGYSFWLAVIGMACFSMAAVLSILTTVLIFRDDITRIRRVKAPAQTDPKQRVRNDYTYTQV